jgi:hypothetical protein
MGFAMDRERSAADTRQSETKPTSAKNHPSGRRSAAENSDVGKPMMNDQP